jgi:uncharacterized protein YuzE
MADMIGESWEYAVQLQVLYNDPEGVDDWEPDWEGSGSESLAEVTGASAAKALHFQVQPAQPAQNGAIAPSTPLPQTEPLQPSAPALEPVVATSNTASQTAPDEIAAETTSRIDASEPTFIQAKTQADAPISFEPEQPLEAVTEATEITAVQLAQLEQVSPDTEANISATLSDESADESAEDLIGVAEETEIAIAQEGAIAAINAAAAELADSLAESMDVANAAPDVEVTQPTEALPESLDASSLRQAAEQMSEKVVEAIFEEYDPEKFDQTLNQTIDEAVESILKEFEAGSAPVYPAIEQAGESVDETANLSTSTFATPLLENAATIASPQLQVTLEREAYVVRRGRSFNLMGQVELLSESQVNSTVRVSKMQIRLHDPKTSQIVAEVHQPLADKAVPFSFSCPIATPAHGQTHLFLGEVLLYAVPTAGIPTKVLATQSFTVAADMEELLEAIATEPTPLDLQPPLAFANDTDILNLEFLDLLNSPGSVVQFQPSNSSALPPQLYPAKPGEVPTRSLELPLADDPNFTLSGNAEAVKQFLLTKTQTPEASETPSELPEELVDESPNELAQTIADLELVEVFEVASGETSEAASTIELPTEEVDSLTEAIAEGTSDTGKTPETDAPEVLSGGEAGDRPEIPITSHPAIHPAIPDQQPEPTTEPLKPQDRAFPTAKLKNRFWSRLNSLATDADPKDSLNAPPDQSPFVDGITLGVDADLVAQEVVVDDDLPPARFRNGRWEGQADTTLALPDEEPVPTPQIELPKGELIAGKSVCVIVKLPALTPRIYVKLWLHDRQTRSLLDGPHWLMNFLPNGLGELEVRTQLIVPFGCFEIQFEAIAIEMATQRESHKIIVDRMVMPPDLPTLSLDELDV